MNVEFLEADWVKALGELDIEAEQKGEMLMHAVGVQVIAYLRSLTSKTQPPVGNKTYRTKKGVRKRYGAPGARKGGSAQQPRKAHPGGWADISGNLASAYAFEVSRNGEGITLTLSNHMEYAAALDAKDGYFVLRGVTGPGGPIDLAVRKALVELGLDWEIEHG